MAQHLTEMEWCPWCSHPGEKHIQLCRAEVDTSGAAVVGLKAAKLVALKLTFFAGAFQQCMLCQTVSLSIAPWPVKPLGSARRRKSKSAWKCVPEMRGSHFDLHSKGAPFAPEPAHRLHACANGSHRVTDSSQGAKFEAAAQ